MHSEVLLSSLQTLANASINEQTGQPHLARRLTWHGYTLTQAVYPSTFITANDLRLFLDKIINAICRLEHERPFLFFSVRLIEEMTPLEEKIKRVCEWLVNPAHANEGEYLLLRNVQESIPTRLALLVQNQALEVQRKNAWNLLESPCTFHHFSQIIGGKFRQRLEQGIDPKMPTFAFLAIAYAACGFHFGMYRYTQLVTYIQSLEQVDPLSRDMILLAVIHRNILHAQLLLHNPQSNQDALREALKDFYRTRKTLLEKPTGNILKQMEIDSYLLSLFVDFKHEIAGFEVVDHKARAVCLCVGLEAANEMQLLESFQRCHNLATLHEDVLDPFEELNSLQHVGYFRYFMFHTGNLPKGT